MSKKGTAEAAAALHISLATRGDLFSSAQAVDDWLSQLKGMSADLDAASVDLQKQIDAAVDEAKRKAEEEAGGQTEWEPDQLDKLVAKVRTVLEDAGLDALRKDAVGLVDDFTSRLEDLANLGPGDVAIQAAHEAVSGDLAFLDDFPAGAQKAIRNALADKFSGPVSSADVAATITDVLGKSAGRAKQLIDGAVQHVEQIMLNKVADAAGLDVWYYYHPMDNITRPFCRAMGGKGYTREMLDGCDNGQLDPVIEERGGYGCRGKLYPISAAALDILLPGARVLQFKFQTYDDGDRTITVVVPLAA